MNTPGSHSRSLAAARAIALAAIAVTAASPAVYAQHFYDHDRQWKSGRMTDNGMVPDDYLVPVGTDSSEITRSTPPFGYYARPGSGHHYSGTNYGSAGSLGYSAPARPAQKHIIVPSAGSHSMEWLNGMGGVDAAEYDMGGGYLPPPQPQPQIQQQAELDDGMDDMPAPKPTRRQLVKPGYRWYYYPGSTGGLIQGGGGTPYRMAGRGQY